MVKATGKFPANSTYVWVFLKNYFIIVDLQCSVNFCCTESGTYIYIHSFFHVILHHVPSQVIRYGSLCYTAGSPFLSTPCRLCPKDAFSADRLSWYEQPDITGQHSIRGPEKCSGSFRFYGPVYPVSGRGAFPCRYHQCDPVTLSSAPFPVFLPLPWIKPPFLNL